MSAKRICSGSERSRPCRPPHQLHQIEGAAAVAAGLLLGFRLGVRHLYADDIDPEQVHQRLRGALEPWPRLRDELQAFDLWLQPLIARTGSAEG